MTNIKMKHCRPVKIAFFHIMRSNFSGAAKNIFRLVRRVDIEKLEPILVGQAENELTERVGAIGIEVFIVPYPPALDVYEQGLLKSNPIAIIRILIAIWNYNVSLYNFYKLTKPQVIWADNIRTFLFVYVASKLCGCKVIWNIWSEPKGKIAWCLHRLGLILADAINLEYKSQGQKIFGSLAGYLFFQKKIVPLYTGVTDFESLLGTDIRHELSLSPDDILILMASNISPAKGQLDLINAMGLLVNKFPDLHLLFAGQPPETHSESLAYDLKIKDYAAAKNLSGNIHFLGWRSDVHDLMHACDIYVSTSYSESFPDAVREAMQAGKPVVVTNVGGTFELVKVNVSGFLFEPGDVEALVRYLDQLVAQGRRVRTSFGAEGKRIIEENFSTEIYVKKFEEMVLALDKKL